MNKKKIITLLITFLPFLLFNAYIIFEENPTKSINWNYSFIGGVLLALGYTCANWYKKNK